MNACSVDNHIEQFARMNHERLQSEAAHNRLVREALKGHSNSKIYGRCLLCVGSWLVKLGQRLELAGRAGVP